MDIFCDERPSDDGKKSARDAEKESAGERETERERQRERQRVGGGGGKERGSLDGVGFANIRESSIAFIIHATLPI